MRCRRNKEINIDESIISLTNNEQLVAGQIYITKPRTSLALFDYNFVEDSLITFAQPINLSLMVIANYIEYQGEVSRDVRYELTNITRIVHLSSDDEYLFYSNSEVELLAGQVGEITIMNAVQLVFTHIDVNALVSTAYNTFNMMLSKQKYSALAFFGSYGHSTYVQNKTQPVSSGVPTMTTYAGTQKYVYKAYLITQVKSNTQLTLSIPEVISSRYTTVGIYKPSTNSYTFISSMSLWTTTSKSFTITNNESDESTVLIFNFAINDDDKDAFDKMMQVEYTKITHKMTKTEDGETFAKEQEGVACSLTQRLSLIKGELWYQVNTGLPLFDKTVTTTTLDAWIVKTIMAHPDVVNIKSFKSNAEKHAYHCDAVVITRWGDIEVTV